MQKKLYVRPGIVILDLTKTEATALREHARSGPAARKLGDPEVNLVFARIVSRLRENRGL
jgi:hypothetical protein